MNIGYILVSLCLLLGLSNCQRGSFQPEAIDQPYITFGKGGGMVNQVDTYYLLQNGRVYQHENLTETYTPLARLDKATRQQVFFRASELPDTDFGCQEPGNIYYFLTVHTDTVRQCTWGSSSFTPPESIASFHQYLYQLTSNKP